MSQSAAVACMLAFHRLLGTWRKRVNIYITMTEFARQKFIQGGLPAEKIVVKPNFVQPDPGLKTNPGNFAIFVGRLSPDKGIISLVDAWRNGLNIPIKVVGDGPLRQYLENAIRTNELIEYLGQLPHDEVIKMIKDSRFLIFPSEWYENLPFTILEAFATGSPVVAADRGAAGEIVRNNITGIHFRPGDPADLIEKVIWAWKHPDEMAEMGKNARQEYVAKYTVEQNYPLLMNVYQQAVKSSGKKRTDAHANRS
jgi:glycosyltransferase involved in cell wall biosynthesis